MKEAYYFSHDSNARQDPKILAMMSVYGPEGYGRYWILVEMLREQSDFTLDKQGKYTFNAIAMQMHCNKDAAEQFVNDCIDEFDLFQTDGIKFWSNSLLRRMAMKEEISQKRKKAAEKRWSKREENTIDMQMHSKSNADGMQGKESKVNESKEKENKENKVNKPSSPKQVYDEQSIHHQLATRLLQNILSNNPDYKTPNLQSWANDVRLMMERDNRTEEQIIYLMDWCQNDSFWKSNILSTSKLREKFDQLVIRVKEDIQKQNKSTKQEVPRAYQSLQDWADEDE